MRTSGKLSVRADVVAHFEQVAAQQKKKLPTRATMAT